MVQKLQKKWKVPLSNAQNICFEYLGRLKTIFEDAFIKMFAMANFEFKLFWMLFLAFIESGFKFLTQKFAKMWKMTFSGIHNIYFWLQGSFKANFEKACSDKTWI